MGHPTSKGIAPICTPTSTKEEEVYKSFTFRWSPSLSERCFTKSNYPLATYSVQGGGQPSITEEDFHHKAILNEGLVMDGTVLPPVIFTNYDQVPANIEDSQEAHVIYIPDLSQPSADLTLRWLDTIKEYLEDSPLVIHDRGPEYIARDAQQEFKNLGISTMSIPAQGGAFVNPCDNAFNAQLRRHYFTQNRETSPRS
jgi:hypothetical protein